MLSRSREVRHVVTWLPAVRWITCAALWAVLVAGWVFPHLDLSLRAIAPLGLTAAICRTAVAALMQARGAVPRWLIGLSLSADAVLLTGLLDITGGPFNPFIVMFGIYVWLAAVTVSARWGVLVGLASVAGFGWLVVDHLQAMGAVHHRLNDLPTHLFTMWLAGGTTAELVSHYVVRADDVLAQRQRLLDEARERATRSEHLASLTTLAAGAAHELSTPLATIAVAARELDRTASRLREPSGALSSLGEDARLIRTEVDRCQVILDRMSGRAGAGVPLSPEPLAPAAIAELAAARLTDTQRSRLRVEIAPGAARPSAAGVEAAQALSSLLKNAFDASDTATDVQLRIDQCESMIRMEVRDRGTGMSEETIRRAGEPFYTTKEPGRGLGLGLFLARTFAERCGGSLRLESDEGTTAILEIPAAVALS